MPSAPSPAQTRFFQTCLGVFQGGGCRGAAFAGAYAEAVSRGVGFSGVAGTSAGAIVAALVGAGATPSELETIVSQLDFREFLQPADSRDGVKTKWTTRVARACLSPTRLCPAAEIWVNKGLYSSQRLQHWLDEHLSKLIKLGRPIRFEDLPTPTWIVATDLVTRDVKVWSSWDTPKDEVAFATRCSCSIPGFFQPVNHRYVDGGALSNLPVFVFEHAEGKAAQPFATRILAFSLEADEDDKGSDDTLWTLKALADTMIDGASKLQLRIAHNVHVIPISTGQIRATDFEKMTAASVKDLVERGRHGTVNFFDDELGRIQSSRINPDTLVGGDEIYGAITEQLQNSEIRHVVICDEKTSWVYALYPALLEWRMRGVRLTVVLTKQGDTAQHGAYRRRLLGALGADVVLLETIPFRGFLFDPEDHGRAEAVVMVEHLLDTFDVKAVRYTHAQDFAVIRALLEAIKPHLPPADATRKGSPTIVLGSSEQLLAKLRRHVTPYSTGGVKLGLETVRTDSLVSLSKLVKGYKYQQMHWLGRRFNKADLPLFEPALVTYEGGAQTIVTPPVVELTGGKHILVQGNTRALQCLKQGISELRCVVVRDVGVALPAQQRIPLRHVLVGGRTLSTKERYGQDIDKDFRQIEWATHHPEETLV